MFRCIHRLSIVAAICALTLVGAAQERDRSKVSDKYTWQFTHIYPSDEAWRAAKDKLVAEIPKIKEFKGTLGSCGGAPG